MSAGAATDTIVAIATPPGRGAVGILRLSGPQAFGIARQLSFSGTQSDLPTPRVASLRPLRDAGGEILDRGLVLVFPAPHSYTGEDVVEFQSHGGPVLLDLLQRAACQLGARPARAGEFSERAFLNDRLDLVQAEGIADLIDAASRAAVLAARRSLDGEFSRRVEHLAGELLELRVFVEGALDFSDEDIDWLSDQGLSDRLGAASSALDQLLHAAAQGRRLREGLTVVIAGRPNVGKSTLLNRLAGADAAIVSDTPGTTRDVLREHLLLDGLPVTVIDTAGLRNTGDAVEREGIRRAWLALERAELALYLSDDREGLSDTDRFNLQQLPPALERLILFNKCDLSGRAPAAGVGDQGPWLRLSAGTGAGFEELRAAILRSAGLSTGTEGVFSARARHLDALQRTQAHLRAGLRLLRDRFQAELIAEELRLAHDALGEIAGRIDSEALLGAVFSRFCIGK